MNAVALGREESERIVRSLNTSRCFSSEPMKQSLLPRMSTIQNLALWTRKTSPRCSPIKGIGNSSSRFAVHYSRDNPRLHHFCVRRRRAYVLGALHTPHRSWLPCVHKRCACRRTHCPYAQE